MFITLLRRLRARLARLLRRGTLRRIHDSGASLAGLDLRGFVLDGLNLEGRDMRGADLRAVPMRGATLRGADLREARLVWADLRDADLSNADLSNADMRRADLRGAVTDGAKLGRQGADPMVLDERALLGLGLPDDTPDWLLRRAGLLVRGYTPGVLGGPSPEVLARLDALDRMRGGLLETLFALEGRPDAALDCWRRLDRLWHQLRRGDEVLHLLTPELARLEATLARAQVGAVRAGEVVRGLNEPGTSKSSP